MLFGRVEVKYWGVRAKEGRCSRSGVGIGITGWGGVKAKGLRRRVGAGVDVP